MTVNDDDEHSVVRLAAPECTKAAILGKQNGKSGLNCAPLETERHLDEIAAKDR